MTSKQPKPLEKDVPVNAEAKPRRIGFAEGQFTVPDDFDRMFEKEIEALFTGADGDGD